MDKVGETNNNILGYTKNSFAQGLSSGGSFGSLVPRISYELRVNPCILGEGTLQALKGSSIEFGTDVGM